MSTQKNTIAYAKQLKAKRLKRITPTPDLPPDLPPLDGYERELAVADYFYETGSLLLSPLRLGLDDENRQDHFEANRMGLVNLSPEQVTILRSLADGSYKIAVTVQAENPEIGSCNRVAGMLRTLVRYRLVDATGRISGVLSRSYRITNYGRIELGIKREASHAPAP